MLNIQTLIDDAKCYQVIPTFRVIGREMQDLEARQEAEDSAAGEGEAREPVVDDTAGEPDDRPDRTAADEFWANYQPGL